MNPAALVHLRAGQSKGQWWPLKVGELMTAAILCPGCGDRSTLQEHVILLDGTVQPSFECGCGLNEYLKLDGWKPEVAV